MNYETEEAAFIQPVRPAQPAPQNATAKLARSTAEYRTLDAAHHIHPFSDMDSLNRSGSRVIVKAEGVYLWDSEGNKIIDGMAGVLGVELGVRPQETPGDPYRRKQGPP